MLYPYKVMQDLGHSRKAFFQPLNESNIEIRGSRGVLGMFKVMQDLEHQP